MALMRYTTTVEVSHVINVEADSYAADEANLPDVLGNLANAYESLVRSNDLLAPEGELGFAVDDYRLVATATRSYLVGTEVLVVENAKTGTGDPVYYDGDVLATVVLPVDEDGDYLVQAHEGVRQFVSAEFVKAV